MLLTWTVGTWSLRLVQALGSLSRILSRREVGRHLHNKPMWQFPLFQFCRCQIQVIWLQMHCSHHGQKGQCPQDCGQGSTGCLQGSGSKPAVNVSGGEQGVVCLEGGYKPGRPGQKSRLGSRERWRFLSRRDRGVDFILRWGKWRPRYTDCSLLPVRGLKNTRA